MTNLTRWNIPSLWIQGKAKFSISCNGTDPGWSPKHREGGRTKLGPKKQKRASGWRSSRVRCSLSHLHLCTRNRTSVWPQPSRLSENWILVSAASLHLPHLCVFLILYYSLCSAHLCTSILLLFACAQQASWPGSAQGFSHRCLPFRHRNAAIGRRPTAPSFMWVLRIWTEVHTLVYQHLTNWAFSLANYTIIFFCSLFFYTALCILNTCKCIFQNSYIIFHNLDILRFINLNFSWILTVVQ